MPKFIGPDGEIIVYPDGDGGKAFIENYLRVRKDSIEAEKIWLDNLRTMGVKAAHPLAGYLYKNDNCFRLVKPYFNLELVVGDLVALGDHHNYYIVRIVGIDPPKYCFEYI